MGSKSKETAQKRGQKLEFPLLYVVSLPAIIKVTVGRWVHEPVCWLKMSVLLLLLTPHPTTRARSKKTIKPSVMLAHAYHCYTVSKLTLQRLKGVITG